MPRRPLIRSNEHFYHIVSRCNNKDLFYLPIEEVWKIMSWKLKDLQERFSVEIGAFVLMNNHFHLIIRTPKEDIDRVMYFFMKELTAIFHAKTGRVNRIFGGRYRGCIIENHRYLLNVYKYVFRNPVAAGLILKAEDYPYSSLHFTEFKKPLSFRVTELLDPGVNMLEWINEAFPSKEAESMKFGLSRTQFRYKQTRVKRVEVVPRIPDNFSLMSSNHFIH